MSSGLKKLVGSLPKRATEADLPNIQVEEEVAEVKRQTLYLPRLVHERLRELAFTERVSQQELFRRAINMLFEEKGIEPWDQLKRMSKK